MSGYIRHNGFRYRRPTRMRYPDDLRLRIGQLACKLPIPAVAQALEIAEPTVRKCWSEYGGDIVEVNAVADVREETETLARDLETWRKEGKSGYPLWIAELIRSAKAARMQ